MLVSIITAVHQPSVAFLPAAAESVHAQVMPPGWTWEWLVQQDGPTTADLPGVLVSRNPKAGVAATRNMALGRAQGDLVRVFDADDRLTPGALARDIEAFEADPGIGWTTSAALDLLPDGGTIAHPGPPDGRLAGKAVVDAFADEYRLIVHPATLCIRRDLAVTLGGWMALPAGEDTGLLLAAAATADGWFTAEPGLLYRKHDAQITGTAEWVEPETWAARMALIAQRARLLSGR